jgi:hypothetical protein
LRNLPFDRVAVDAEADGTPAAIVTADEFLAIPVHQRVTWLLERKLTFLLGTRPVDSRVALMALRERWKSIT